jgi:hypothetical protein
MIVAVFGLAGALAAPGRTRVRLFVRLQSHSNDAARLEAAEPEDHR